MVYSGQSRLEIDDNYRGTLILGNLQLTFFGQYSALGQCVASVPTFGSVEKTLESLAAHLAIELMRRIPEQKGSSKR